VHVGVDASGKQEEAKQDGQETGKAFEDHGLCSPPKMVSLFFSILNIREHGEMSPCDGDPPFSGKTRFMRKRSGIGRGVRFRFILQKFHGCHRPGSGLDSYSAADPILKRFR
jgi:hypothetical protein